MTKKHAVLLVRGILILALVIALAAAVTGFAVPAQAEDAYAPDVEDGAVTEPHIIYVHYTDQWLFGLVELPENGLPYYARITYFLPGNTAVVLVLPVEDAQFRIRAACEAEYIEIQIVDTQEAFIPGTYTAYESQAFSGLHMPKHPPDGR